MPVALKRTKSPDTEEAEELDRIAHEQLASDTELLVSLMKRFGKGAGKWSDSEWEWEEPDWEADPETWPRLAKLLYVFQAMVTQFEHWQFKSYITRPEACPDCTGSPSAPEGYRSRVCALHSPHIGTVQRMARNLGWREKGEGDA